MMHFKEFKKTTVGMKPQSETGGEKAASFSGAPTGEPNATSLLSNAKRSLTRTKLQNVVHDVKQAGEKQAYDYAHESSELHRDFEGKAKETPKDPKEEAREGRKGGGITGGVIGGMYGSALGAAAGGGKGALLGLGLGALAGGGLGAWAGHHLGIHAAMSHKLGIEEAQRVLAMPETERKAYLQHLARQNEISEREAEEWSRHHDAEDSADRRHDEHMDAMHGAGNW